MKIKKYIQQITLSFALIGAVTGSIALILSSIETNKMITLTYFLEPDHTAVWGNTTIWVKKVNTPRKISLYFSENKRNIEDNKWDGKYPLEYFV